MRYTVKLNEISKKDVRICGGKAANLGELLQVGFQVPGGFCVTSEGFRFFVKENHLGGDIKKAVEVAHAGNREKLRKEIEQLKVAIRNGKYPEVLQNEMKEQYKQMKGNQRLAIRSSATAEDLADASFAGQQETFLGIRTEEQLLEKIKDCFASLYDERALSYREKMGYNQEDVALAVVVQEMVDSKVSGIVFTENPVTRKKEEMMINASYGLGESIVSGQVNPDIFVVDKKTGTLISKELGSKETLIQMDGCAGTNKQTVDETKRQTYALSTEEVHNLWSVCKSIEEHYGKAMDIEWAFNKDELYILQARAITTMKEQEKSAPLEEKMSAATNQGKQEKMVRMQMNNLIEHCPVTPYPLDFDMFMSLMDAKGVIFAEHGIVQEKIMQMDENGVISTNEKKPKYKLSVVKLPFQMKGFLEYEKNSAEMQKYIVQAKEEIRSIEEKQIREDEIAKIIQQLCELVRKLAYARFRYAVFPYVVNAEVMEKTLHKVDQKLSNYDLMSELSYKTWSMNQALQRLAEYIKGDSRLLKVYKENKESQNYEHCIKELGKISEICGTMFAELFSEYGWKADNSYVAFSTKSWNEDKASLFSLLSVFVNASTPSDVNANRYSKILKKIDEKLSRREAEKLKEKIEHQRAYHVMREESLYLIENCFGISRELLRRLLKGKMSQIANYGDALYLTIDEVINFEENKLTQLQKKIEIRKKNRKRNIDLWEGMEVRRDQNQENVLKGVSGNRGKAKGKVRIINSIAEFSKLKEGEILVCRYTDPEWTPLFSIASAMVSDTGGPLSHSAIVAREFGIPAVLAIGDATKQLKDGQLVEVDGDGGVVNVLTE